MVVFACNGCGDTLKKNAVDKHPFNCRRSISCMDCGQDFHGSQYQQHLSCITENEKYGGGNYVAPVNKGEVKQEAWLSKVREAIRTQSNMPSNVQKLLNSIISFDNIPRKKAKFEKFVVNSCREKNASAVNQAWEVFESCIKPAEPKPPVAVISNGQQTSPEQVTMAITEEKKKKRKSKDIAVDMEESPKKKKDKSIVEEPVANGVEKKKKKKDKSFVIDTEPEPVEKKKKKKKADEEEEVELESPKKKQKSSTEDFSDFKVTTPGVNSYNGGGGGTDWVCTCGESNFADRRFCRGCREKNPTADDSGDWVCPKDSCGMSNFASRTSCRTCHTNKDGTPGESNAKEGDWSCSGCGFSNFASRFKCRQCNTPNAAGGGGFGGKPGDWNCASCSFSNFASRYNCKQCNEAKPADAGAAGGGGGGAGGDWSCSGCGFSNFASRFKCKQCFAPNAAGGGGGGFGGKPGDWNCGSCSFSNFASRYNCKQCNEAKPAGAGAAGGNTSFGGKPGDWNCASCSFSNFASRYNCKQCNEAKPADAGGAGGGAAAVSGDWECSGCGFSNFASRFKCKQCFAGKPGAAGGGGGGGNEENWTCNCGFSNFPSRTSCKSCYEKKNASIPEHRVGMSHMSFDSTEAEVKEFFLPLEPESIKLLVRDGQPQGKANVYFKTHADAVKAMEKDQQDIGTWRVNLYLNSTESGLIEGATAAPATPANKITFEQGENLEESVADDTMNETTEADESTSEKKKFKWDKTIKSLLKAADNKTMSLKKLVKALIPAYTEQTGEECDKSEIKEKLQQRINKSSKFTLEGGNVSM